LWGLPLTALLAGTLVVLAAAQPGMVPEGDKKENRERERPGDTLPLAPGNVLAVYDNLAEALRKMPRAVLLSPEKYKELLDEITRLRAAVDRPRPRSPGTCVLKGKVEGNLVQLTAGFEFATEKPGELIRLGCGLAQATGVSLDGKTPPLLTLRPRPGVTARARADEDEGFAALVEKPG
jgi:hypothetical protein